MKIIGIAIQKVYRFNCPDCGTRLEADPKELFDMGNKISRFFCPVCEKDRFIGWNDLKKRTVYENGRKH